MLFQIWYPLHLREYFLQFVQAHGVDENFCEGLLLRLQLSLKESVNVTRSICIKKAPCKYK